MESNSLLLGIDAVDGYFTRLQYTFFSSSHRQADALRAYSESNSLLLGIDAVDGYFTRLQYTF
jgi:hypothetical protein